MPRKPDLTKKERYNDPFPSRLRELQEERHVTQEQLKVVLNLANRQSVTGYVDGETLPTIDKLVAVANYFDVTPNYLLGFSDAATNDIEMQAVSDYTGLSVDTIESLRFEKKYFANGLNLEEFDKFLMFSSDLQRRLSNVKKASDNLKSLMTSSGIEEKSLYILRDSNGPVELPGGFLSSPFASNSSVYIEALQYACFKFSRACDLVLEDMYGVTDLLESAKCLEGELFAREEAADDGQHIEASDD